MTTFSVATNANLPRVVIGPVTLTMLVTLAQSVVAQESQPQTTAATDGLTQAVTTSDLQVG